MLPQRLCSCASQVTMIMVMWKVNIAHIDIWQIESLLHLDGCKTYDLYGTDKFDDLVEHKATGRLANGLIDDVQTIQVEEAVINRW